MLNHEKVYAEAKKDKVYKAALAEVDENMPRFTSDTLRKGIWASAYYGWVLGYYGAEEAKRRKAQWEEL